MTSSQETDRAYSNKKPTAPRARTGPVRHSIRFAIMLQWLPVKLRLIGYSCVIICERRLAHFHQSREMEISLRESSRRNLARIVRYSRIRAMPYWRHHQAPGWILVISDNIRTAIYKVTASWWYHYGPNVRKLNGSIAYKATDSWRHPDGF